MSLRHDLSTFVFCVRKGIKQSFGNWVLMLGSLLTYGTIMLLYAGVIHMIPAADLARFSFGASDMIWYLGTAEYLVFSTPSWYFKELQTDIESGRIHLDLLRPVSPALVRTGFWTGEALARAVVLFLPYLAMITLLSGGFALTPLRLLGLFASMPVLVLLLAIGWYFVGASCFWFVQAEPAFWVWQKCVFLLGAMLWPLSFYPGWLQHLAWATPFPAMMAIGARWALGATAKVHILAFAHQFFWLGVFLLLLIAYERKILRHIQKTGA